MYYSIVSEGIINQRLDPKGSVVNPYALYNQMLDSGYTEYVLNPDQLTEDGLIKIGSEDPLVAHGLISPRTNGESDESGKEVDTTLAP